MGGSPGDGMQPQSQQQSQPQPPYPPSAPPYASSSSAYPSAPPATPPTSGSITRFATPDLSNHSYATSAAAAAAAAPPPQPSSSYAERSYAARSAMMQQQQQQQQQHYSYTNVNASHQPVAPAPATPPPPLSGATAAGTYATHAAQPAAAAAAGTTTTTLYYAAQHQARQQPSSSSAAAAAATAAGKSSYAARSQQAQQQAQWQQQSYYAYGGPGATMTAPPTPPMPPQPQQQQPPPPSLMSQQQGMPPPQQPYHGGGGGGGGGDGMVQSQLQSSQPQQQQQAYPQPVGAPAYGGQQQVPVVQYGQQPPPQYISSGASVASTLTTNTFLAAGGAGAPGGHAVATSPMALAQQQQQQQEALQQRLLTDATRKIQEHAYYMRQAMEQKNLPVVFDRAAHMVGELGGPPHGQHHHHHHAHQSGPAASANSTTANSSSSASTSSGPTNTGISPKLNPKMYYELYMRALEDMPVFQEYLLSLCKPPIIAAAPGTIQIVESAQQAQLAATAPFTMLELYNCTQYCPRVVSRLYLQIAAGSALITSGEAGAKYVLNDLAQAVRCEQNPIRGLFLRNYLLTALRDQLPDTPPLKDGDEPVEESILDKGTVKDTYEFILNNFMEMNKLWVRIQHLPGEGQNKDVRKRRERERNDLRILVGTNLVRLSQLECVTSQIYGEVILPQILEHIVVCGDPLSQAYLMDCLVQVFPDEYHIETLPILLNVCPRLRDKVNIRTILQGLMDRLANYLADEELLDENDTNEVKKALARDSFSMFEECVQNVYNARGPKLTSKEVIRLQTALLQFSLKCYPEKMMQVNRCLGVCVSALKQANASYEVHDGTMANVPADIKRLDEASVVELEKLLSIPLDSLGLKVLGLEHYGDLSSFLPWSNRREVAMTLLKAVDNLESTPHSTKETEQLFAVIEPLLMSEEASARLANNGLADSVARASSLMAGLGVSGVNVHFNEQSDHFVDAEASTLVSKLIHLLQHDNTDTLFEMLTIARNHVTKGGGQQSLVAIVFAAARLTRHLFRAELQSKPTAGVNVVEGSLKEEAGINGAITSSEPATADNDGAIAPTESADDVAGSGGQEAPGGDGHPHTDQGTEEVPAASDEPEGASKEMIAGTGDGKKKTIKELTGALLGNEDEEAEADNATLANSKR